MNVARARRSRGGGHDMGGVGVVAKIRPQTVEGELVDDVAIHPLLHLVLAVELLLSLLEAHVPEELEPATRQELVHHHR